jgi:choline dehydrogenase
MSENFDFIVVGGGSAGGVIASRLSEDPSCRVALIEAGERPPEVSAMPIAPAAMQLNPATDWMYTADPGKAGLGLNGRRMPVPRGKMLGGSSGINYMVYVRGHPGDFDSWAAGGATGWSYADVLPYFRKSEGLATSSHIVVDGAAHNTTGRSGYRSATRCCRPRASSSTRPLRRASSGATTTAVIAAGLRESCR